MKKFIALIIAVAIVACMVPFAAFADISDCSDTNPHKLSSFRSGDALPYVDRGDNYDTGHYYENDTDFTFYVFTDDEFAHICLSDTNEAPEGFPNKTTHFDDDIDTSNGSRLKPGDVSNEEWYTFTDVSASLYVEISEFELYKADLIDMVAEANKGYDSVIENATNDIKDFGYDLGKTMADNKKAADEFAANYIVTVTEGADKTFDKGSAISFKISGDLGGLVSVSVDGKELTSADYTVQDGTLVLADAFANTLAEGDHTVSILIEQGIANASFSVKVPVADTADNGVAGIALVIVLASAAALLLNKKVLCK